MRRWFWATRSRRRPTRTLPATGHDYGDYGIVHTIDVTLNNPGNAPATVYLFMQPLAGPARGTFLVDGNSVDVGCVRVPSRYQVTAFNLAPGQSSHVRGANDDRRRLVLSRAPWLEHDGAVADSAPDYRARRMLPKGAIGREPMNAATANRRSFSSFAFSMPSIKGRHSFEDLKERIAEGGRRPSTRSLRRYLAILGNAGFPIYFDRAANVYRFAEGYSLRQLDLSSGELFGLVALRSLGASIGGTIGASIDDVAEKLVGSAGRSARAKVAARSPVAFRLSEIALDKRGEQAFSETFFRRTIFAQRPLHVSG